MIAFGLHLSAACKQCFQALRYGTHKHFFMNAFSNKKVSTCRYHEVTILHTMVVVASELVSRRLQLDRMLSPCLVKYRTSEWSIPAILSSVVWASGPTEAVAAFVPFMMGESERNLCMGERGRVA